MKYKRLILGISAAAAMGILTLDSKTALVGAMDGVVLCLRTIIPSLFPFFFLSALLNSALSGEALPVLRPVSRLCGIPDGCESVLISGFLGGYPVGAQCIGTLYADKGITAKDAQRLLAFCSNAGPSFLFGILGSIFPEKWMVWALWMIHIGSALCCACIIRDTPANGKMKSMKPFSASEMMTQALRVTGTVCGWVILFRVVLAFLQRWLLWLLPEPWQVAVFGFLELSNGCCELTRIGDVRLRFIICSALLAFGGICVCMQTVSVIGQLSVGSYFAGKLIQTLFSLLLSAGLVYDRRIFLLLPILYQLTKITVAFIRRIMYNRPTNHWRKPYAVSQKNRTRLCVLSAQHSAGG